MWILPLVAYLGYVACFIFLTLAIASGLYYLSEIVEEHTVLAKRLLTQLIYSVMAIHILLWLVDGFPFWPTALAIGSHGAYLANMRRFPYVQMTDPLFLVSCALVFLDHWVWMGHFSQSQQAAYHTMSSYYERPDVPSFAEIASYIGLCVWLVPFALFVSLSAGDNVLPRMGSEGAPGGGEPGGGQARGRRQGMIKAVVDSATAMVGEAARMMGAKGRDRPGRAGLPE